MANDLTGDFDVVAEFTTLAANRVLAAMHRAERFPHSMSLRVDDNPPAGSQGVRPSIVGSVDTFGDPTVNPHHIGTPVPWPGRLSPADPLFWALDGVVNANVVGAFDPPVVPSKLQGRAQLQLAPPTIEVTDASGSNVTVKLPVMSWYSPDPHTPRVAEFVRGELQITAPVDQVASPDPNNVRMIDVDIRGDKVIVNFDKKWSSQPVSAEDLAGVNLLIRNALRTSFLPSSNPLPSNINYMQFKTLLGAPNAIAVLLNMDGGPGNPGSFSNGFLGNGDDFALAAGRDFVLAAFPPVHDDRVQHLPSAPYDISNIVQTVDLQGGQLLFTMTGHAHRTRWPHVGFDFTVKQALTLNLVATTAGGPLNTAQLAALGDVSFEITSIPWPFGWVANHFTGSARDSIRTQRDAAIDAAQPNVMPMLNIDDKLGTFLQSLLKPAPGDPSPQELKPVLAYTSVDIWSSGIVLHGSLAVTDWPPAYVVFEKIPGTPGGARVGVGGIRPPGTDYSALRTWIPGGAIQQYEWSWQQGQILLTDKNKFVLVDAPMPIYGYGPLCLTVSGLRLSASGPVAPQPVTATVCGYSVFPVGGGINVSPTGKLAMVALTQPGPGGLVQVVGHTPVRVDRTGQGAPNLIVHFADGKTSGQLERLTQALRESGRTDTATAVLAVLTPDVLAKTRHMEGVIYAENQDGVWEEMFGVKTAGPPATLVVAPRGDVLWRHQGELDAATLAAALRKSLVAGASVRRDLLGLSLRIGRPAPNFLFELAPGRGLTLRKLVGRAATLVFWKSSSKPSIETVRDLQEPTRKAGGQGPVVLAINDGEAPELAKKAAAENGLSAILVMDPKREISLVYGVNIWPTIVFLDAFGLVRQIRYGRLAGENVESPSRGKAASR